MQRVNVLNCEFQINKLFPRTGSAITMCAAAFFSLLAQVCCASREGFRITMTGQFLMILILLVTMFTTANYFIHLFKLPTQEDQVRWVKFDVLCFAPIMLLYICATFMCVGLEIQRTKKTKGAAVFAAIFLTMASIAFTYLTIGWSRLLYFNEIQPAYLRWSQSRTGAHKQNDPFPLDEVRTMRQLARSEAEDDTFLD